VAQALGDGILALFGAPIAHEDHPQRALYAALRMQQEMRRYADTLREQGRHTEMDQLQRAPDQAKAGHGQIGGVMGEPGVGKSRLFYEFKLTSQSGCLVLESFSVSHGKASPYLPVIELLKTYYAITIENDERTRREKVGGKVLMLDRRLEEILPYLFSLLGLDDATSSLQQMDPQIRRRRTFETLKKLLLQESLNQSLVLIF
jgi:predicted ATPase